MVMKIALAQINPVIGDFAGNCHRITTTAREAADAGCQLVIMPELAISGYPPRDLVEHRSFLLQQDQAFHRILTEIQGIAVICGIITKHHGNGKSLHNSAVFFSDGEIITTSHKRLLPSYDVFDETRHFEPGMTSKAVTFQGLRLGITICEDIFNDEDALPSQPYLVNPVDELNGQAPLDLLINIAASPYSMGKQQLRRQIFGKLAGKNKTPLLYVNQVGGQDGILFDGSSMAFAADGSLCQLTPSFQENLLIVDSRMSQDEPPEPPGEIELLHLALITGIRDYLTKCGFSRALVGLSGGIDSALTCALAVEALGADNVMGIAMPSPYSSRGSIDDARQLADNLGITFTIIPIDQMFSAFNNSLAPLFSGRDEDITEQNIQARTRGTLLMAVANKENRLLLATGNKSELAVGYCTLYGDMCGALAPLADVPKELVYELSRYINREKEFIPKNTISKPPSAELAPDQTDQDDLPPYEVLDPILQAYLEDHLSPEEIIDLGYEKAVVEDVIRRIKRNEYKRQQAPPGLKVTSKAFGYGRRYPIAEKFTEI